MSNDVPIDSKYYQPSDLAKAIIRARHAELANNRRFPKISDDGLRKLIELCYAASHLREEGAYVCCQLYSPSVDDQGLSESLIPFETPFPLTNAESLRKLSVVAPVHGRAIVVEELGASIVAVGLLYMRSGWELPILGHPFKLVSTLGGGSVAILAPGHLKVYGNHPAVELRAGKLLCPIMRYLEYPATRAFFAPIIRELFQDREQCVKERCGINDAQTLIPYSLAERWQSILEAVRDKQHGGAIVVATQNSLNQVQIGFPLRNLDFGKRLVALWDSCFQPVAKGPVDAQKLTKWQSASTSLSSAEKILTELTAADGCVVVDHQLNAIGFGAKLLSSPDPVQDHPDVRVVNPWTLAPDDELELKLRRLGTRHNSAFRFCCGNENTAAFVVSQDGDVRIFLRKEKKVMMIDATGVGVKEDADEHRGLRFQMPV